MKHIVIVQPPTSLFTPFVNWNHFWMENCINLEVKEFNNNNNNICLVNWNDENKENDGIYHYDDDYTL